MSKEYLLNVFSMSINDSWINLIWRWSQSEESIIDGSKMYINKVGLPVFETNSSDLLSIVLRSLFF